MGNDSPRELGANDLRILAAQYRSRADRAEPEIARLLSEIADDLEVEASKLAVAT